MYVMSVHLLHQSGQNFIEVRLGATTAEAMNNVLWRLFNYWLCLLCLWSIVTTHVSLPPAVPPRPAFSTNLMSDVIVILLYCLRYDKTIPIIVTSLLCTVSP